MLPSSTALMAGSASGFMLIHHCFETSGSTMVLQRWHFPTLSLYGSIFSISPSASSSATTCLRASKRSRPANFPAAAVMLRVFVDHLDAGKVVALAGLEIVGIVRGRDLDRSGAEAQLGHFIQHDGNVAIGQRQPHRFQMQAPGARVLGIDGHGGIAQHRLRPRGRDHQLLVTAVHRIDDVPQVALRLFMLDFEIAERGLAARAPVDDVIGLIDQALFIEPHEGFAHGAGKAGVQGEVLTSPVAAHARALHLLHDAPAVLLFPLPHASLESFAPQIALGQAFLGELPLHHDLRGDAGVIGAGDPQRLHAGHTPPANLRVDDGVLEHVPHVQRAGYVGRRNGQRKVRLAGIAGFDVEDLLVDPPLGPVRFEPLGFIDFLDFHGELRF